MAQAERQVQQEEESQSEDQFGPLLINRLEVRFGPSCNFLSMSYLIL